MAQAFQQNLPLWAQMTFGWVIVGGFFLSILTAFIAGGRDD